MNYAFNSLNTVNSDGAPTSSSTVIIELSQGQKVRVKNHFSTAIYGTTVNGMESWFTGVMLYPLDV